MKPIESIGIIGAGTMGAGIAEVAAAAGFRVHLCDVDPESLDRAIARITANLDRAIAKGTRTAEATSGILGRIQRESACPGLRTVDFVIEAVREDFATKARVFAEMDRLVREDIPITSNTSSISITRLASSVANAGRVVGMHFMNPVPKMPLVEIVRGLDTSNSTLDATRRLAESLGKTAVVVSDSPGFVSNRVLMPMINEAIFCLSEGVGTPEAIDAIMTLGMSHPMGPLSLADLIGLDVCLEVMEVLHAEFGDSKYRPCPLLRKMVDAGRLGRKSRRGFYDYPGAG